MTAPTPRNQGPGVTAGLLALTLGLTAVAPSPASGAETAPADEFPVKAVFLLNFVRFTTWPSSSFPTAESPIIIGVPGKDPCGDALAQTLWDKKVGGRPFVIKRFASLADLDHSHLLFISSSEEAEYVKILEKLVGTHTVAVGETPGFAAKGGVFGFILQDKKVRFEINLEASKRASVELSSRILSVGVRVNDIHSRP